MTSKKYLALTSTNSSNIDFIFLYGVSEMMPVHVPSASDLKSQLLARFREIGTSHFALSESGILQSQSFGQPTSVSRQSIYRAKILRHPHLRQLFGAIEDDLGRFYYGEHSNDDWMRRYVFPSAMTTRSYAKSLVNTASGLAEDAEDLIANKSKTAVEQWIDADLLLELDQPSREGPRISVLLGDVGCGKSTFTKYVTNVFRQKFIERGIVPSRVECRKLLSFLQERHHFPQPDAKVSVYVPIVNDYIIRNLFRDLIHFAYSSTTDGKTYLPLDRPASKFPCIFSDEFERCCEELPPDFVRMFDAKQKIHEVIRNRVDGYRRTSIRERPKALIELFSDDQGVAILSIVVSFFAKRGAKFCIFFDGFDYIQLADFVFKTPQSRILEVLSEWLKSGEACVRLPMPPFQIIPKSVVSLRISTFGEFNNRYSQAFGRHDRFISYIAPPSFPDLYAAFFKNLNSKFVQRSDAQKLIDELFGLMALVRKNIREELNLQGKFSFGDLFNGNVRHQLNLTRDILLEIIYETLAHAPDRFDTKITDLVTLVTYELRNFIKQKRYRFVDLLLYSANNRFVNFVSIPDLERLEASVKETDVRYDEYVKDNNYDSGYVGNVFNYHIRYGRTDQLRFLLEKIRILELLTRANEGSSAGLTKEQLRIEFKANGWGASPLFDLSLYILVREGFVYADGGVSGGLFRATSLGRIAVGRLVQRVIYLENVYFGTLLPVAVRNVSVDVTRDPNLIKVWVHSSLFHIYLFLKLINQAEKESSSSEVKPVLFFFDRIFQSVVDAIEAIVDEDLRDVRRVDQSASWLAYRRIVNCENLEL